MFVLSRVFFVALPIEGRAEGTCNPDIFLAAGSRRSVFLALACGSAAKAM
jgi:hypothetical protein